LLLYFSKTGESHPGFQFVRQKLRVSVLGLFYQAIILQEIKKLFV